MKIDIIDFETGLINALGKVFNKVRGVGCYYHYVRNIFKESKKLKINKKSKFKEMINKIILLPFQNKNIIKSYELIKKNYNKKDDYQSFFEYYDTQWKNTYLTEY